ncbi:MAG: hypothetical protein ACK4K9_06685 [Bacteroidia bacterium]
MTVLNHDLVTGYDIIREQDMNTILSYTGSISETVNVTLSQPSGFYLIKLYTPSAIMYKRFTIQ